MRPWRAWVIKLFISILRCYLPIYLLFARKTSYTLARIFLALLDFHRIVVDLCKQYFAESGCFFFLMWLQVLELCKFGFGENDLWMHSLLNRVSP